DLSSLGDPKFIIYDDSQITFNELRIQTLEPIDITGALLVGGKQVVALVIDDADIDVNLQGTISLVEDPTDQGHGISELASNLSLWNIDLLGTIEANLPMYFPTKTMPLGGSDEDLNADGFADNVLHVDGEFRGDNDFDLNIATPEIGLSLQDLFALLNDPKVLLTGVEGFFFGIGKMADGLDAVEIPLLGGGPFDGLTDDLRGLGESVLGVKTDKLYGADAGDLQGQRIYSDGGVGKWLQDQIIIENPNVFDSILGLLREELFEAFGGLDSDQFAFVVPDMDVAAVVLEAPLAGQTWTATLRDADGIELASVVHQVSATTSANQLAKDLEASLEANQGFIDTGYTASANGSRLSVTDRGGDTFSLSVTATAGTAQIFTATQTSGGVQFDENGKIVTKQVETADDVQLVFLPEGLLTFNLMFGGVLVGSKDTNGEIVAAEIPIDFSAGMPGLNLEIDGGIETKIDYLMGIGLGLGAPGVFLDTSGINQAGEEIALDVDARLAPDAQGNAFSAMGTLGFLQMDFLDVNDQGGSGISGHLGLDITDEGGDGRWTIGEGLDLALRASAAIDADIQATVAASVGGALPKVSAIIRYDQVLGDVEFSTDGGAQFDIGSPQVVLENVTLDVGSVFDSFLNETLDSIKGIIDPMRPVVDLLTAELDLGFDKLKMIDIAYLSLPAKTVDTAKKVIEVFDSTLEFLANIENMSAAGPINFGTFNLTASSLKDADAPTSPEDVATGKRNDDALTDAEKNALSGPDQKGLDGKDSRTGNSTTSSGSKRKGRSKPSVKRFSIPVLEDPASLLDFMLGRGETTLFYYDLPDLDLHFEYGKSFPVFPGLNARLFGAIGVETNFDFGYDTLGLSQWKETGFEPGDVWRVFNGFFLDDHGEETLTTDLDEITLTATIAAGASLGIGGLAEAGVQGGIEANIGFDLNDKETVFVSEGVWTGDGKLYGSELIDQLTHGPQCMFDVHGELALFVEAFLWIGLDLGFSEITLFEAKERFVNEVVARFDFECEHDAPDTLGAIKPVAGRAADGGTLILEYD
ncbi:MAG: hypothetical protein JRF63_10135, partial [Deltaproteobacteria bacterium]|nr:hypothetical protein [Deltaproteobacteria bacterium]